MPSRHRTLGLVLRILATGLVSLALLVGLAGSLLAGRAPAPSVASVGSAEPVPPLPVATPLALLASEQPIADAAEKALPAVVNISTRRVHRVPSSPFGGDPLLRRFFGEGGRPRHGVPRQSRSLGSGVVVDSSGLVLTNNHVVADAEQILVTLHDGREFEAKVLGTDAPTDLAVIRLQGLSGPPLSALKLAVHKEPRLGEIVLAVGNPFGLAGSVTMGIISAKGRGNVGIVDYEDFLQTDAAINPGNSGGALLDLNGDLVGINTAIASRSGGNQGVGFAIPADLAADIMDRLVERGVVERSWLGVSIQPFTASLAKGFGLELVPGVLISGVQQGSPASRAGLQAGDVVLAFGQEMVSSPSELRNIVALSPIDQKHGVKLIRKGKPVELNVKLELKDSNIIKNDTYVNISKSPLDGCSLENLADTDQLRRRQFRLDTELRHGVLVSEVEPGSRAARSGLQNGDVIVEVNGLEVKNIKSINMVIDGLESGLVVLVRRGEASLYIALG